MEISYTAAFRLISVVRSLTKDSPLKRVSKNELKAAIQEINNLGYENDRRGCLNRALVHLESAYCQFEPKTICNFLDDKNRVLWEQRTYKNDICMTIAIIHHVLGNTERAKRWLSDELSQYGWVQMPDGALNLLGFNSTEEFFNLIFGDNGETYKQLQWSIKEHHRHAWDYEVMWT